MVINKTMLALGFSALVFSSGALADGLTWQYMDARYQRPSGDGVHGTAGQVSVYASENWVLQGGVAYARLKENDPDLKISQTRFDVALGRVLNLGDRASALLSAGYTHLRYDTDVGDFSVDGRDHVANAQLVVRAALTQRFEAEGSIGVLFDDEDASDPLWNAGLRYRITPAVSVLLGANGIASDAFDSDDILYEAGFRFDLQQH